MKFNRGYVNLLNCFPLFGYVSSKRQQPWKAEGIIRIIARESFFRNRLFPALLDFIYWFAFDWSEKSAQLDLDDDDWI